jgi:hypothetical protein
MIEVHREEQVMPWHEGDARSILEMLQRGPVLVVGGRGTGKSTLVEQISELLEAQGEPVGLLLNGRTTSEARRQVKEETNARKSHSVILIDDLDIILTAGPDDSPEDLQELAACLWGLFNSQKPSASGQRAKFLATSSVEFQGPAAYRLAAAIENKDLQIRWTDSYSYFTEGLQRYRLSLWKTGWRDRWKEEFRAEFRQSMPDELTERWSHIIVWLTGGHPALFGPIVNRLKELCTAELEQLEVLERKLVGRLTADDERSCADEEIVRYVEDVVWSDPMRRIRSILRRLKDSTNPVEAATYSALVEIAADHSPEGARPPQDPHIRLLLKDEALAYEDMKTGNFHIPGDLIRRQILQALPRSQPVFSLVPDGENSDAGELVIQSGTGTERMAFSGVTWRVLREIYREQGERVSSAELRVRADLADDKRAVTNAIQRLQSKLRSYGDVIVNEYGKGYRFVSR